MESERFCPPRGSSLPFWIVASVSTVVAFAIWLISRVNNVDTKITEELGAKVVEIANKCLPRPFRFLFLAPHAG